jgi:hypothetical protein
MIGHDKTDRFSRSITTEKPICILIEELPALVVRRRYWRVRMG